MLAWPVRLEDEVTPQSVPPSLPNSPDDLQLSRLAVRGGDGTVLPCPAATTRTGPAVDWNWSRFRGHADCRPKSRWFVTLLVEALAISPTASSRTRCVKRTRGASQGCDSRTDRDGTCSSRVRQRVNTLGPSAADSGGQVLLRVPLRLNVRPVVLDRDTDFLMGFFGVMPPSSIPAEQRWRRAGASCALIRDAAA